jgi:ABC-type branched-subunit amino acid transport system ATPase component
MGLELQNLSFGFTDEKMIINDLSLKLDEGNIYALMGSNGAGKTTLFNLISGFIRPKCGQVAYNGKRLTSLAPFKVNRHGVSRTFQDLRVITKLSVKENVVLSMKENPTDRILTGLLPSKLYSNASKEMELKADEILKQFYLSEVKDSYAGEISYGQQKLLTLACCVANGATLLLLDEPVAGIQPEYRNKIAILIKQLKEQGKAILVIEHNTDFIADVADKIFFLHDGKISTFDNMSSLKKDHQVMKAYI